MSGGGVPGRALPAVLEEARGQVPSLSYTTTREKERERESRRGERERAREGGRRKGRREVGRARVRERERKRAMRRTDALGEEGEGASKREPTTHPAAVLTFASHLQREKQPFTFQQVCQREPSHHLARCKGGLRGRERTTAS